MFTFRLGSDPEKLSPFKILLDQFQKFGKIGKPIGTTMTYALTINCADVRDLDNADVLNEKDLQKSAPAFNEFLNDVLTLLNRLMI